MANEAKIEVTETGAVPVDGGWFVLNAREARWEQQEGRGACCVFEGRVPFTQVGLNLRVLGDGDALGMYHWEADQEDFLVISGEPLLIIEGAERRLKAWDLVHCPPGANHMIVGVGETPCVLFALGARQYDNGPDWGAYTVDPIAAVHGVSVARETNDPAEAYAGMPAASEVACDPSWLPSLT